MSKQYLIYFTFDESVESTTIKANYDVEEEIDYLIKRGKTFEYRGQEIGFDEVLNVREI
ncbi:hypothetical protein GLW05_20885 [Pontibacillus yanchengensis]|uniref:Uncharacterized protein n=1 Tax=Pontibacillus yanchengensis TaxID=462910 RepID=A0A6I5A6K6_9BACI|nr:hypothetical protein [Pontibacillus yanchengensis]MYL36030.1 hypothetical protein [Pontibacillus yanchengensis]